MSNNSNNNSKKNIPLFIINQFRPIDIEDENEIPGYFAISTSNPNIEDTEFEVPDPNLVRSNSDNNPRNRTESENSDLDPTEKILKEIAQKLKNNDSLEFRREEIYRSLLYSLGYESADRVMTEIDRAFEAPVLPSESEIEEVISRLVSNADRDKSQKLSQMISSILNCGCPSELIITVHGFNNNFNGVQNWYKSIHEYINEDPTIKNNNLVFIGYRWASEFFLDNPLKSLKNAHSALPILLRTIFWGGSTISLLSLVYLILSQKTFWLAALIGSGILFALILTLIILRLVVYFRDSYRAANFGVLDLVELIRQLDRFVFERELEKRNITTEEWQKKSRQERSRIEADIQENLEKNNGKIKLTFLGHSMGCFAITNTIRILSDVFDSRSIGTINSFNTDKQPPKDIGRVFQLERLILVAPDIPVETVIPRRANFLRSALRRVEEAYTFTNEGDLALRLASTAANYFSFPSRTRFSGYRLGNLTVKHFANKKDKSGWNPDYGIVNLNRSDFPYNYLEIRSSNREHRNLTEEPFAPWIAENPKKVTNRFSYFDCTDYRENNKSYVSQARKKNALNFCDYICLIFAYMLGTFSNTKGVDTHGGYFRGKFSQNLIYRLAFVGVRGLFKSFISLAASGEIHPINTLDRECAQKGIQVILSPEHQYKR